jgi:hypothetical protein
MHLVTISAVFIITLSSCAPRVYEAPRLGAEYRFEEGLKRQKHPQNLFSKQMRKDLEKQGQMRTAYRDAPPPPANMRKGTNDTSFIVVNGSVPDSVSNKHGKKQGTAPADSVTTPATLPVADSLHPGSH